MHIATNVPKRALDRVLEPSGPTDRLVNNILRHLENVYGARVLITDYRELAPGVIATHDSTDEYDIHFDLSLWGYRVPEIWANSKGVRPQELHNYGYGTLSGIGSIPQPTNFEEAHAYAQSQLVLLPPVSWYTSPRDS